MIGKAAPTHTQLLRHYLRPERARVALLGVLLFAHIGLPLLHPQLVRAFVDRAVGGEAPGTLVWLAAAYLLVAVVAGGMSVGATHIAEQIAWASTNALRSDLARHALSLDMSFHNRRTPGEMIERIDGDVRYLAEFFSRFVLKVVGSVLLLAGILAITFREETRLGVAFAVYTVAALAFLVAVRRLAVPRATASRAAWAELFGFVEERIAGVDDIRASGAGEHVLRAFARVTRQMLRKTMSSERWSDSIFAGSTAVYALGLGLTVGVGIHLFLTGRITIGTVFLLFLYLEMIHRPVEHISEEIREFQRAGAGINRIRELAAHTSSLTDGERALPAPGSLPVAFEDVTFAYPDDAPVLHDLTFAVAPGEVLGVVGRTGSGKTTLARLITRLYDAAGGAVRVGGVDVRELRADELRRRVAVVTQDVRVFHASVRDNLTLFDDTIPDAQITRVLGSLGLGEWYERLPEGLDTDLGAAGPGLSAGEAQLIAFARVFLRDPGLVILDEATARLDPATERLVDRAVDRLLEGRTAIIVAHRLSTLHRADTILVLDGGRVAEWGRREELAADMRSRYARLLAHGIEEVLA